MKIYLVRHGESLTNAIDDERPLSEKGIADVNHIASFIAKLHIEVSEIWHSEKRRARETAEILASAITCEAEMQTRKELDPLAEVIPLADEINASDNDILIVGHMPFMGKLVSQLITRGDHQPIVAFQAGSIICLEQIEQRVWIINWMLSRELF